jgi:hypothetical protein
MAILVYLRLVGLHLPETLLTEQHQRSFRDGRQRRAVALFQSGVAEAAVRSLTGDKNKKRV